MDEERIQAITDSLFMISIYQAGHLSMVAYPGNGDKILTTKVELLFKEKKWTELNSVLGAFKAWWLMDERAPAISTVMLQ